MFLYKVTILALNCNWATIALIPMPLKIEFQWSTFVHWFVILMVAKHRPYIVCFITKKIALKSIK